MLRNFLIREKRTHAFGLGLINAGSPGQISSHEVGDLVAGDATVSWWTYNPDWSRSVVSDWRFEGLWNAIGRLKVVTRLLIVGDEDFGVALAQPESCRWFLGLEGVVSWD